MAMKNYALQSVPIDDLRRCQETHPQPHSYVDQDWPLEKLGDRVFEHLIQILVQRDIAAGKYGQHADRAELMQGRQDRGRDIVLWRGANPVGFIQCKHSEKPGTRLARPMVARELLKLLLHSIIDNSIISATGPITWCIATNAELNDKARIFISDAGSWLRKHPDELRRWATEVIDQNASIGEHTDYTEAHPHLLQLLSRLTTSHLLGVSVSSKITTYQSEVAPIFFHVRTVVDAHLAKELAAVVIQHSNQRHVLSRSEQSWTSPLRGWLESLGYTLEPWAVEDSSGFAWIVIMRERRRTLRAMIRGINGEIELADLRDARDRAKAQSVDELWLISPRRVSQAVHDAVESENEFAGTVDEFIELDANFERYYEWLDAELAKKGIDKHWVPLGCHKRELDRVTGDTLGTSVYSAKDGGIEHYIDKWIHDPEKYHISILAEFGMGKTWFCLRLAHRMAAEYRHAKNKGLPRPRVPLYIPLREYAKSITMESLFSDFFFRKHELLRGYKSFEQLNQMGRLLLIFDGFDEMAQQIDRQKMINNFWELAKSVAVGAKVILTCRTEHFPHQKEGRDLLSAKLRSSTDGIVREAPSFEIIHIDRFQPDQIQQAISSRTDADTFSRIAANRQLMDLATRPLMTSLIIDALPDVEAGRPVDISRVFLYAMLHKLQQDIREERTFTSIADKLYFMCELSSEMIRSERLSINYRHFPSHVRALFGQKVAAEKDLDHWQYDMMGQTLLVRDEDGDYSPGHRSLLEFFFAYRLCALLGFLHNDFIEPLNIGVEPGAEGINYQWHDFFRTNQAHGRTRIRQFSAMWSEVCEILKFVQVTPTIWMLLESMFDDVKSVCDGLTSHIPDAGPQLNAESRLGANIATMILALDGSYFSHSQTLQKKALYRWSLKHDGGHFPGAERRQILRRAPNLAYVDLTNADLSDVDFSDAVLTGAKFDGAKLDNVNFGVCQYDGADVCSQQNLLATSSYRGINIWDLERCVLKARVALDGCWNCCFSLLGDKLIVSGWGCYRVLDAATGKLESTVDISDVDIDRSGEEGGNLWTGKFVFINGNCLAFGCNNGSIYLFDAETNIETARLDGHSGCVTGVTYSAEYKILATTSHYDVILWSMDGGPKRVFHLSHKAVGNDADDNDADDSDADDNDAGGNSNAILASPALSPDGRLFAYSYQGNAVGILDLGSVNFFGAKVVAAIKIDPRDSRFGVSCMRFSPDGTQLFVGGWSGDILAFSVSNQTLTQTWRSPHGDRGRMRKFLFHNNRLMAITGNGHVVVVDLDGANLQRRFWNFASVSGASFAGSTGLDSNLAARLVEHDVIGLDHVLLATL